MALSGVENKFPDGIETKMDVSKEMIKLQAKNKELEDNVSNAVLFVNELKAENERLKYISETSGAEALETFGKYVKMTLEELTAIAEEKGFTVKKRDKKADVLEVLYDDLMKS